MQHDENNAKLISQFLQGNFIYPLLYFIQFVVPDDDLQLGRNMSH
jgi:hypothetical protein